MQKRVAILGAAFDPPHYAHAAISVMVLERKIADEIWLCPSPARWDKAPHAPPSLRLEWVELMARELQSRGYAVQCCDAEIRRGIYRGTYLFLCDLRENYPSCGFQFVLGQDAYAGIPMWRDPVHGVRNGERLLAEFPLVLFPRVGTDDVGTSCSSVEPCLPGALLPTLMPSLASDISHLQNVLGCSEFASLSSSAIRETLAHGGDPGMFCFEVVRERVLAENPYKKRRE